MALTKLRRGVLVEMTPQEEAAFEASRRPTVPQAKRAALDRLREIRTTRMNADLTVGQKSLDITDDLRAQLRELRDFSDANQGVDLPVLLPSGKTATVTRAQLLAVQAALADRTKAINDVAVQKADAIGAATTLAEVAAVDFASGWPA